MAFNPKSHDQMADAIQDIVEAGEHRQLLWRIREVYGDTFEELLAMMEEIADEPNEEDEE
jgi:hypothetical protein